VLHPHPQLVHLPEVVHQKIDAVHHLHTPPASRAEDPQTHTALHASN
jgi:hypothetical protein